MVVVPDDPPASDAAVKAMGIILGLIALFFFGFLSGFFIDKRMKRKELEQLSLEGIARAAQNGYPVQPGITGQPYTAYPETDAYGAAAEPGAEEGYGYDGEYPVVDSYAVSQFDEFGGLSALTNAAYPDSDDEEDYYDQ